MKKLFFLLILMLLSTPFSVRAQTGVYAAFSASNFNTDDAGWQYGPTVGLYHDFWHLPTVGAGVDIRGSFLGTGSTKIYSGLLGPRIQVRPPILPLQPYVEGLVGVGHAELFGESATKLEYQVVAGVDWTIFPRIDWRVAEFSYAGLPGFSGGFNPVGVSTGLVLRLP